MKTDWELGFSPTKPEEFERISFDTFIQRKNISMGVFKDGDNPEQEGYLYEFREISKDVYDEILDDIDSPSQQELLKNIDNVSSNQKLSDENTLVIMSAIADLYETIAALSGIT